MRNWMRILLAAVFGVAAHAAESPYFKYDPSKTDRYFGEKATGGTVSGEAAKALAALMKDEILELASRDWGPFVVESTSIHGCGAVWLAANDELLLALSMAVPYLDEEGKQAAAAVAEEVMRTPPYVHPFNKKTEDLRGYYEPSKENREKAGQGPCGWMPGHEMDRLKFKTLYAVWAYAHAFDRWDEVKENHWKHIKKLKQDIATPDDGKKAWDFKPNWDEEYLQHHPDPVLTRELAESERYQHELLRFMMVGWGGFYGNNSPRDEKQGVYRRFNYPKVLSALIGYGRIAQRAGEPDEVEWAKKTFAEVAADTLRHRDVPAYWCGPWLTPEVARMLRDHAGGWIDGIKGRNSVFVGTKKDGFPNDGPWIMAWDAHHWFVSGLGSQGADPPMASMAGFLVHAWLWNEPPERLDNWTDIPLCQGDYWYIQKCAVALAAYENGEWAKVD